MMLGYSLMMSMTNEYGFRTFLDAPVFLNLKNYFKNINHNVSKTETLCFDEYPWIDYNYSPQSLGYDKLLSTGHAIQYVRGVCLLFYLFLPWLLIIGEIRAV